MLRLHPEKRAKASELIHHAWLDGVVVQGEIDVIRRAEDDEARRKAGSGAGGASGSIGGAVARADADAMKPVEDVISLGTEEVSALPPALRLATPVPSSSAAKENAHGHGHGRTGSGAAVPMLQPLPPNGKVSSFCSAIC